ncbi:MAG: succinylglutamate desuccinylase/aspartoacylase family protein, partial [Verrucomicrobiota bacterium]
MPRRRAFSIGGHTVKPGESRDLLLDISESYTGDPVRMPVHVIHARTDGPVVLVTAAIHGDEINGTGIIHDFLFGETIQLLKGTLVLVPVVNIFGFEAQERYLPDRRDLNRSFPGNKTGSLASRVAYTLMQELPKRADFCIDLHSAAAQRTNYPNVRADLANPEVRRLARAFGCALVVDGKGPIGSFRREATRLNCPTIILEAGEPWKMEPSVLQIGVQGIRNVLIEFGMLEGARIPPPYLATIRKTTWLRATVGGILKFHIAPGAFVEEDEPLATNYSIFGKEQNILRAPTTGIVVGMATMPAVKPGEPVCHLALVPKARLERFRRQWAGTTGDPYRRAR